MDVYPHRAGAELGLNACPLNPSRILLVDPDRAIADSIPHEHLELLVAENRAQALNLLAQAPVHIVVSADDLPDGTGSELLTTVRREWPQTKRIFLAGSHCVTSVLAAINEAEVYRFLTKPCRAEQLAFCIDQALEAYERERNERAACPDPGDARQLGNELDQAIRGLHMAFQPILRARTGTLFGYEALVRTDHAVLTGPNALFDRAEQLGRVLEVEGAIRHLVADRITDVPRQFVVLTNVHPATLMDERLLGPENPLRRHSGRVVLEIIERDTIHETPELRDRVATLREAGFRIAIDDLGAGYAGLTSFALLVPEIVKFDRELISGIDESPTQAKLVESFTTLCREMNILTIAEGIETIDEHEAAVRLGCDLLQGYLYGRPSRALGRPRLP